MQSDLLARQRHALIQDRLRAEGRVLAVDLAQVFGVSEDTIRRDLREMAAAGLCERVYGGALSLPTYGTTLAERLTYAPERKELLARTAATHIRDGMTVFLDAGSTNLAVANALSPDIEVTIATNTPVIAAALMQKPKVTLVVIGGKIDRQAGAAVGAKAQRDAEVLRPDLCVLGTCGIDEAVGLSAFGFEDAEFKRFVAGRSASVLVAVTNDKIGQIAPHAVVPIDRCSTLVMEHDAPTKAGKAYEKLGLTVERAGKAAA